MLLLGIDCRGLVAPMKIWLAFLLVMLLSYVVSAMDPRTAPIAVVVEGVTIPPAWTPIVFTFNAFFLMAIGTLVAGCPDRRLLRSIAGLYCVFSTPFLVYVDLTGEYVWGRLTAGLQPNVWGLVGLTVCLAAFARKPGPLAAVGFATGVETILLSSSRENLLALAAAVLVFAVLSCREMSYSRLWAILLGSCATLILAALLLDPYIFDAISYINKDVLLLNSEQRGFNTGFSGRADIWSDTVNLWLKSPLLGVGFRQHEQFLAGVESHNAYLAMLADTGLLGLVVYLVLQIWSLIASWNIEDPRTRRFVLTAIVGYIIMGFFDRRTINAGNPYGVFFVMCCSVALVDQSLRKAAALWRKFVGPASTAVLTTDLPVSPR